jgi:hypothetical protein
MDSDKKRAAYDRQFKIDAVNLLVNGGHSLREIEGSIQIDCTTLGVSGWQ